VYRVLGEKKKKYGGQHCFVVRHKKGSGIKGRGISVLKEEGGNGMSEHKTKKGIEITKRGKKWQINNQLKNHQKKSKKSRGTNMCPHKHQWNTGTLRNKSHRVGEQK